MPKMRFSPLILICLCLQAPLGAQTNSLQLTRRQAVERALDLHTGTAAIRESQEEVERQRARKDQVRSALLPQLSAGLRQSSQTNNLEALGLRPQGLFRPPSLVGPFSTFDARLRMQQTLFSLNRFKNLEAAKLGLDREEDQAEHVQDLVASQVSRLYVMVLRREAEVEATESRLQLARELLELSHHQREVGMATALDETRAELELSQAEQEQLAAELETREAKRQLLFQLDLPLDSEIELTDTLDEVSSGTWTDERARQKALSERKDLQALEAAVAEARASLAAARANRWPELQGFAEYGTIGSAISNTIPTWQIGAELRLPIFTGMRISAEISERVSLLRSRQLAASELQRQIDLETRSGLDRLRLTTRQVALASESLALAEDEVARAERRFRSGVSTNLEVIQAQSHLKQMQDSRFAALYAHQLSRIALAETLGVILTELP